MQSVYIHIPFCSNICNYCDFAKVYYNKKYIDKYLNALSNEIKSRYDGSIIKTLYIGGGTPSSLDCEELNKLFSIIKQFNLSDDIEFTMEANVENLTLDKIKLMKENNVNRVSLGVQTFDSNNLKYLNRLHNKSDVFNTIKLLKENDINNINIDLIYGIDEDINKVKKDIDLFLELDIPHLSCYSLIIEDHTILNNMDRKYINEDIEYEMYKYIEKSLEDNNYIHYEISNYAKDGYYSKHNLVYWNNQDYIGFGLGSVSYINGNRITNTKSITKYLDNKYMLSNIHENIKEQQDNELMLGFRKLKGINLTKFKNKYNDDLENIYDIEKLLKNNYLIKENNYLRINKEYIYVSDEILLEINRK